jgi:phosphate ABC transporter phosphate-binding protein
MNYKNLSIVLAIVAIVFVGVSVYTIATYPAPSPTEKIPTGIVLNGAGATFPMPLYQLWGSAYYNLTGVKVNYPGGGSGTGQSDFGNKLVDFAGSDPPLTPVQYNNFTTLGLKPVQIPMTIGGITIAYNVTGLSGPLNLTAPLLAAIFQGNITHWNDVNLTALNPGLASNSAAITICHRSDSSGSTNIFTSYLNNSGAGQYGAWKLGVGKTVSWPTSSLGASGNAAVAALIKGNANSIGYVELYYALSTSLSLAKVENPWRFYIMPSLASISAAVAAVGTSFLPASANMSYTKAQGLFLNTAKNSSNANAAYPISSFSYVIVYQNLAIDPTMTAWKAEALINFLYFGIYRGQTYSTSLYYVPLPANVVSFDEKAISSLYFAP